MIGLQQGFPGRILTRLNIKRPKLNIFSCENPGPKIPDPQHLLHGHSLKMSAVENNSLYLAISYCLLGEVYWRAWKASGGEFRERLETGCIQDYMDGGMRAHRGYGS
jgi:hypothetical protein